MNEMLVEIAGVILHHCMSSVISMAVGLGLFSFLGSCGFLDLWHSFPSFSFKFVLHSPLSGTAYQEASNCAKFVNVF